MFISFHQRKETNQKNAACFGCSFLALVGKKRTKEAPLKRRGVLSEKKRTCRIFSYCDILSP